MNLVNKIKVIFLKGLGYISMFGLSGYLMFDNFYDGTVSSKVELGMTFLIGVAVLFFIALRMIAKSLKNKEIAYEVTRAMGKPTQALPPVFIEIWNMCKYIIPLGLIAWLEFIVGFYESSIYMVILYISGAIILGYFFRIIAVSLEQAYIKAEEQRKEDELVAKIKS